MKVKDLIKKLEKVDPERLVILSSDEEGNCYHRLEDITPDMVYDEVDAEIGYRNPTKFQLLEGHEPTKGEDCVVLWP